MIEFGKLLGCAHSTISGYESGKIVPSRSMLLLVLRLALGDERTAILDELGVDRDQQEGWNPGELEEQLDDFEHYLRAGGRKEFATKTPRREFIALAKELAGDVHQGIPQWLVETLRLWRDNRGEDGAVEFFEHVPIYLDVQLKTLQAKRVGASRTKRRNSVNRGDV